MIPLRMPVTTICSTSKSDCTKISDSGRSFSITELRPFSHLRHAPNPVHLRL